MSTMVQHPENDYDIDTAVIFVSEDLPRRHWKADGVYWQVLRKVVAISNNPRGSNQCCDGLVSRRTSH
jgi:hypothetical protein